MRTLRTVQAGRGIAAVLVVLYHLNRQVLVDRGVSAPLLDLGWAGVDYFFVLSGFIIYYVHSGDIGTARVLPYLRKRFVRLYPAYWVILATVLALLFAVPAFGEAHQRDPMVIASSIPLVPLGAQTVVGVAWTLYHEALFYALFALWILDRKAWWLGAAWLAACAGRLLTPGVVWNEISHPLLFLTSPLNLLFGLGVLAGWWLKTRTVRPRLFLGVGALLLAASAPQLPLQTGWAHLTFGAGCAMLLVGLAKLELGGRVAVHPWACGLGDASYATYLTHTFLIAVGAKAALLLGAPVWVEGGLLLLFALLGGLCFHWLVERPLLAWLRPRAAREPDRLPDRQVC